MNQTDPTAARYRQRPNECDAIQWTGTNVDELRAFAGTDFDTIDSEDRIDDPDQDAQLLVEDSHWVGIRPGDWVLKFEGYFVAKRDEAFRAVWEPAASAVVPPPTDRADLRERIAAAIHADLTSTAYRRDGGLLGIVPRLADAVLAVLPEQTDRAAVARVRALHQQYTFGNGTTDYCAHCNQIRGGWVPWPCPTVRALDVELAVEAHDTGTQQPTASTAPLAAGLPLVKGNCPACHSASLFLGSGGYVTCARLDCPEPDAATTVLEEPAPVAQQPAAEERCTCADAGDCFAPAGHYADCPAAEQQAAAADGEETPFLTRVLELFSLSHADLYDGALFWRVDDGHVHLFANVSDVFAWGGADCEPITQDTLPALEQAYADLKAIDADLYLPELYTARQRGERPQGAAYPDDKTKNWRQVSALFDACGPERPLGLGNPKAAPAHKESRS